MSSLLASAAPRADAFAPVTLSAADVGRTGRTAFALAHAALGAALAPAESLRAIHGSRRNDRTTLVGITASRLIVTHVERRPVPDDADAHLCWTHALPLAGEAP